MKGNTALIAANRNRRAFTKFSFSRRDPQLRDVRRSQTVILVTVFQGSPQCQSLNPKGATILKIELRSGVAEAEQAAVRSGPPSTKHGRGDGGACPTKPWRSREGWLRSKTVPSARDNIFIPDGEPRSLSLI